MTDKEIIEKLGGPAAVARLLRLGKWGTNRVCNWRRRGIPPAIKLEHGNLLLKRARDAKEPASAAAGPRP